MRGRLRFLRVRDRVALGLAASLVILTAALGYLLYPQLRASMEPSPLSSNFVDGFG